MGTRYWHYRPLPKRGKIVLLCIVLALAGVVMGLFSWITRMPGQSYKGVLAAASPAQIELAESLRHDVRYLASEIGERNVSRRPAQLEESAQWIEHSLVDMGWRPQAQEYTVEEVSVRNIVAEFEGASRPGEIVVVGAHYDSVVGSPGANDNGSGVASLLAIARWAKQQGITPERTLRLVFFVNEEPPWFQHEEMGSLVYASECHKNEENTVAMLSLETMGYYSGAKNSQEYPLPILRRLYPTTGDFIGFVGTSKSATLVRQCVDLFRKSCDFPSEGAAIPGLVQGVGWSDHWSFQIHGYKALMVTDTAPYRYPHYHTTEDTPDKLDYGRLAKVTEGLTEVVAGLCSN